MDSNKPTDEVVDSLLDRFNTLSSIQAVPVLSGVLPFSPAGSQVVDALNPTHQVQPQRDDQVERPSPGSVQPSPLEVPARPGPYTLPMDPVVTGTLPTSGYTVQTPEITPTLPILKTPEIGDVSFPTPAQSPVLDTPTVTSSFSPPVEPEVTAESFTPPSLGTASIPTGLRFPAPPPPLSVTSDRHPVPPPPEGSPPNLPTPVSSSPIDVTNRALSPSRSHEASILPGLPDHQGTASGLTEVVSLLERIARGIEKVESPSAPPTIPEGLSGPRQFPFTRITLPDLPPEFSNLFSGKRDY